MPQLTTELVEALRRLDACRVSNAIETFECRLRNEGFADGSIRGLFGDLRPIVGHAVTARIRCSTPPPSVTVITIGPIGGPTSDGRPSSPRRRRRGRGWRTRRPERAFIGAVHARAFCGRWDCAACIPGQSRAGSSSSRRDRLPALPRERQRVACLRTHRRLRCAGRVGGLRVESGDVVWRRPRSSHEFDAIIHDYGAAPRRAEQCVVDLCQSPDFSLLETLRDAVEQLG